jgi:hypothetical protein
MPSHAVTTQDVERIEVFSRWVGFADPPSRAAKLTIIPFGNQFLAQQSLVEKPEVLLARIIDEFLTALFCEAVPQLNVALFDIPERALRAHYECVWTDDYPTHLLCISLRGGRQITVRTESAQAFMLPLIIADSANSRERPTFDPALSRAISALLPDGYLEKERLSGQSGMLDWDIENLEGVEEPRAEPSSDLPGNGRK